MFSAANVSHRIDPSFTGEAARAATRKLSAFVAQDLSHMAWALGKLKPHGCAEGEVQTFMQAWSRSAVLLLHTFNPQNLSNSIWAVAQLGIDDSGLISAFTKQASNLLGSFADIDLANVAWALGTLNHRDDEFLTQLVQRALPLMPNMSPQAIANISWTLTRLDCQQQAVQFLTRVVECSDPRRLTPQVRVGGRWY